MIAIVVGVFIVVVVTVVGTWFLFTRFVQSSDAQKRRDRILGTKKVAKQKQTSARVALFETEEQPKGKLIPSLIDRYNLGDKLRTLGEQAGVKVDPIKFMQISLVTFVVTALIGYFVLPEAFRKFNVALAGVIALAPLYNLIRKKNKRLHSFEEVFPDTLEFISRSMRAGHAFSVSLEMIHREFPEPLAGEFRRTFEEHNLGLPLDTALQSFAKRVPLLDVHFFVSAVLLQKRTGGNLAEILDKLAYVIRERFKLRGRIKAIAAHGKMTGTALSCIPMGVAALMFFVNPADVRFFIDDEIGNILAGGAVALQLVGYLIIRKIVSIEI